MDVDLLSILEGSSQLHCDVGGSATAMAVDDGPDLLEMFESQADVNTSSHDPGTSEKRSHVKLPNMSGKVGSGRHGDQANKDLLALHMRHCKSLKQHAVFKDTVADILSDTTLRKDGNIITVMAKATTTGLVIKLCSRSRKGNRFQRAIPWVEFFQAAYGNLKRTTHIALSMNISKGMVSFMSALVGSVHQGQQLTLLTKLILLARSQTPLAFIQHMKWDETSLLCTVNPDRNNCRVRSTWETMVARQRLILVWRDGSSVVFRLVMPPVVLLGSAAQHIYYALKYHPSYRQITELVRVLARECDHRAQIFESDGAYSNDRLYAHLLQRNKVDDLQYHLLHMKCQSHQTQLLNMALISAVGHSILNRLYGMTVFIRNLGYWMRIKQALLSWVESQLDFRQHGLGSTANLEETHNAALLELIDFLKWNRPHNLDSEDGDTDDSAFHKKVEAFLAMWNTATSSNRLGHTCSHESLPEEHRHCKSRSEAIRKCTDSLTDLFLSSMPSIPAPNKWTTIHGPLDTLTFNLELFVLFGFSGRK